MNTTHDDNILSFPGSDPETVPSPTLLAALDIVSNAHDNGLLMVPSIATPEMLEAAQAITGLSEDEIQKVWEAMLKAW